MTVPRERLRDLSGVRGRYRDAQVVVAPFDQESGAFQDRDADIEVVDAYEHGFARARGREDVADGSMNHAATAAEDRNPIAGVFDLGENVTRHEHGAAFRRELPEQRPHLTDSRRVEAVRGL